MASQHNRTSSYRALIEGNKTVAETREEFLHKKVMGDEPAERKPHGLPPPEVLNEELKTMKVDSRAKSSIAGASSSTFHIYRQNRREERERIEKMYSNAAKQKEAEEFSKRKREREEEEADKTGSRAAKRHKKKAAAQKRAAAYKAKQHESAAAEMLPLACAGEEEGEGEGETKDAAAAPTEPTVPAASPA